MSVMAIYQQLTCVGPVPSVNVQFWKTENSWRLDSSHRWGRHRDISCLVDATDVRTVKPGGHGQ
jgi:hypothetical protein